MARPNTVWLDTARLDGENNRSLFFSDPVEVLAARDISEVEEVLEAADAARARRKWVAGYMDYEAAGAWLPTRTPEPGRTLVWLGVYDAPAPPPAVRPAPVGLLDLNPALDLPSFAARIEAIRRLIHDGDVYQVNFTFPISGRFEGQAEDLYYALRQRQPVPYGAVIQTEDRGIVSLSPELFFRVEGDRIWTRPMKGTAQRGRTAEAERERAAWLRSDAKNRAENLMIVDLLRNDLAQVTLPGSVRVPSLFETEVHPTVIQMTSTVEGRLRQEVTLRDLFHALFPCGSVTGAPKHRAMQRIAELETAPRGVYCGAIGYAAPHGEMVFSVPIRTLEIEDSQLRMGVGSGVVWDSEAAAEYEECLLKARFLTDLSSPQS